MSGTGVQIPALDSPWPDDAVIMVVTARAAPGWRSLAHLAAAAAQPEGPAFPLEQRSAGRGRAEDGRAAFLYRHAGQVAGCLCLASKIVTGYRDPSAGYRPAAGTERVIRPCVLVVWVDVLLRRHGVARQLVSGFTPPQAASGRFDAICIQQAGINARHNRPPNTHTCIAGRQSPSGKRLDRLSPTRSG